MWLQALCRWRLRSSAPEIARRLRALAPKTEGTHQGPRLRSPISVMRARNIEGTGAPIGQFHGCRNDVPSATSDTSFTSVLAARIPQPSLDGGMEGCGDLPTRDRVVRSKLVMAWRPLTDRRPSLVAADSRTGARPSRALTRSLERLGHGRFGRFQQDKIAAQGA
jgi:hypothetical protein